MTKRHAHITVDINDSGQFEIETIHSIDGMATLREKQRTSSAGGFDHEPQVAGIVEVTVRGFTEGRLADWGYSHSIAVHPDARGYLTPATIRRIMAVA